MKRRQTIAVAAGFSRRLAGCSEFQPRDGDIELNIFNQPADPHIIEIRFFGNSSSEWAARAYDTPPHQSLVKRRNA